MAYDDLYGTLYERFPQQHRTVGIDRLSMLHSDQDSHETVDPPVPEIVLRLVTGGGAKSEVDFGDGRRHLTGRRGSFYLAPADATAEWNSTGRHQILLLALPSARVETMLAPLGAPSILSALYGQELYDPAICTLMTRVWQESAADNPAASMTADGLTTALVGTLASRSGMAEPDAPDAPLEAHRLDRVVAFVEAHLCDPISVDDLAEIACLSTPHFARRFRAATGATPHAFVLRRRIEAARGMLSETRMPLSEIALACGFSGQSHFTARFRAEVGTTPGAYRREVTR